MFTFYAHASLRIPRLWAAQWLFSCSDYHGIATAIVADVNQRRSLLYKRRKGDRTHTDLNGDIVPGTIVPLDGPFWPDHRKIEANDNADFHSNNYRIDILWCASNGCGVVVELEAGCDHGQMPGPAVMGFQAFA